MLLTAALLGLLGSFHCVGMCGPIAFMLPVDRSNKFKRILQIFLYHFGRLFSYAIIGLSFGIIGKSFSLFGFQQQLSIIIGSVMLLLIFLPRSGLNKNIFSKKIYKVVGKVKNSLGKELKKKRPDTFFTVGFLNGFLPCGLVYMAVFGAIATGSAFKGSLYMILFGAGTIPLMTGAIWIGNFLSLNLRKYIRRVIPIFLVIIAMLFIIRGLGLGIPYLSPKEHKSEVQATYECHPSGTITAEI